MSYSIQIPSNAELRSALFSLKNGAELMDREIWILTRVGGDEE